MSTTILQNLKLKNLTYVCGKKKIKCIIWWNEVIQSLTIPVWGIFKFYEIVQTLTILRGSKLNFILFKNKDGEVFRRLAVDWVSLPALILFAHTCMYLAEKHLDSLVLFYRLKTRESNSFVPDASVSLTIKIFPIIWLI